MNNDVTQRKNKKTIGILGGMGPLASANLYHAIIRTAQTLYHAEQDTDFPPILIYNLPLFGFNETGFVDPLSVKNQLIDGVKKLEDAGSDCIIIACNTVHHFYDDMQQVVKIPIISMIKETVKAVKETNHTVVGLLSSESTNKLGIYAKAFDAYAITTLFVTDAQQQLLNEIILHVMSGIHGADTKKCLIDIIDDLCKEGAQSIVLGCTELPLAIKQNDVSVTLVDSTAIIVQSALRYAFNGCP